MCGRQCSTQCKHAHSASRNTAHAHTHIFVYLVSPVNKHLAALHRFQVHRTTLHTAHAHVYCLTCHQAPHHASSPPAPPDNIAPSTPIYLPCLTCQQAPHRSSAPRRSSSPPAPPDNIAHSTHIHTYIYILPCLTCQERLAALHRLQLHQTILYTAHTHTYCYLVLPVNNRLAALPARPDNIAHNTHKLIYFTLSHLSTSASPLFIASSST